MAGEGSCCREQHRFGVTGAEGNAGAFLFCKQRGGAAGDVATWVSWARPHAAQQLDGKTPGSVGAGKTKLGAGLGSAPSARYLKSGAVLGIPRCLPAARGFGLRRFPAVLGCGNLRKEQICLLGAWSDGERSWGEQAPARRGRVLGQGTASTACQRRLLSCVCCESVISYLIMLNNMKKIYI